MQKDDDPYEILGVPYDAAEGDIKKAYRKAALKYHPDRQTTEEDKEKAHDVFSKISEAYATLTDPVKRYDWKQANEHKIKSGGGGSSSTATATTTSSHTTASRPPPRTTPAPRARSPKPAPRASAMPATGRKSTMPAARKPAPRQSAMPRTGGAGRPAPAKRAPPAQTFSWARNNKNGTTTDDTAYNFAAATSAAKKKSAPYSSKPGKKEDLRASTMHGTGTGSSGRGIGLFNKKKSKDDAGGYSMAGRNGKAVERMSIRPPGNSAARTRKSKLPAPPLAEDERSTFSSASYKRRGSFKGRGRQTQDDTRSLGGGRRSSSASPLPRRKGKVEIADVTRTPRTGRKRTVGEARPKKAHNPLKEFNRIIRIEFGSEYVQDADKGGLFKSKNITARPLETTRDPNAVLSMSTKTQTEKRKDGTYEVKTITKISRLDGSVEKNVQISVVEKDEAKKIKGQNTDLTIERKLGKQAQKEKKEKDKKESKKKAKKVS